MQGARISGGEAEPPPARLARAPGRVLMSGTGRAGDVVRSCPRTT